MNTQLTPQQQNDLLAMCPCREASKVEIVTCPDKNNIWLKTFVKWAYLLERTEKASVLIITKSWWGNVHASEYLKAYIYDMTEEEFLDALLYTGKVRNVEIKELMDKYKNLHIYFQVQPLGFDLGNAIRTAQAKSKRPLYVLMEHYIGTDKTEQAKDFAFVQQVAQETHVPITLIQYNNEVF